MKTWFLTVLILMVAGSQGSAGESADAVPEGMELNDPAMQGLEFAQALEREGDLYRAITEYKRVIHAHETPGAVFSAWLGICRSYALGRKWSALEDSTRKAFAVQGWDRPGSRQLTLLRALALWNLLRFTEAQELLKGMDPEELGNDGRLLMAWVSLACGDREKSREHFSRTEYPPLDPAILEVPAPEGQQPWIAGTLSAILPGSGQLYAGKPQAAVGAFLVNAILIAATVESFDEDHEVLGVGLGILAFGFYVGNIYGSINYVSQENKMLQSEPDAWVAKNSGLHESFRESLEFSFIKKF